MLYFGTRDDPEAALEAYDNKANAVSRGKPPLLAGSSLRLDDVVNLFLHDRQKPIPSELSQRMWNDYRGIVKKMVAILGEESLVDPMGPPDFSRLREGLAKDVGPVALFNRISGTEPCDAVHQGTPSGDDPLRFIPIFRIGKVSAVTKNFKRSLALALEPRFSSSTTPNCGAFRLQTSLPSLAISMLFAGARR